jgi:hypothetical protein
MTMPFMLIHGLVCSEIWVSVQIRRKSTNTITNKIFSHVYGWGVEDRSPLGPPPVKIQCLGFKYPVFFITKVNA